ncbi:pentapeptide repeat-containing protein [Streptomyces sp. NPDC046821]|uniref:pentapeptide repeat-containing protein n=1 Tax=Streptomyces sp. NPDC046821 TaxID=3154702 RepID=UPI0033BFC363
MDMALVTDWANVSRGFMGRVTIACVPVFKRRPKQLGRHTPNLWPMRWVVPLALSFVGALAYGLFQGVDALLSAEAGKEPINVQDVIKTTVTVLTLVGAVLAGLYAYRKQLLDEGASHRADAAQLAERYTTAAEQLGHEQAAVRLAGVYAMARLADDWPEQRQVCIDVLCAYLRMPYETDPTAPGFMKGEREVRLTMIRTIRDHLQDPAAGVTWCGSGLDFTGAVFDGGDFNGAVFSGGVVRFDGAVFSGGVVRFDGAVFSGGVVRFDGAVLSGGVVRFDGAVLSGGAVRFDGAVLSDGRVSFDGATFSGGAVRFDEVVFSGGAVYFDNARFSGGRVYFGNAMFSGGRVHFGGAMFSGGRVYFGGAVFSGSTVYLGGAVFSGGTVHFDGAVFSGGPVSFVGATATGGQVHFAHVRVQAGTAVDWGPFPAIPVNQP